MSDNKEIIAQLKRRAEAAEGALRQLREENQELRKGRDAVKGAITYMLDNLVEERHNQLYGTEYTRYINFEVINDLVQSASDLVNYRLLIALCIKPEDPEAQDLNPEDPDNVDSYILADCIIDKIDNEGGIKSIAVKLWNRREEEQNIEPYDTHWWRLLA